MAVPHPRLKWFYHCNFPSHLSPYFSPPPSRLKVRRSISSVIFLFRRRAGPFFSFFYHPPLPSRCPSVFIFLLLFYFYAHSSKSISTVTPCIFCTQNLAVKLALPTPPLLKRVIPEVPSLRFFASSTLLPPLPWSVNRKQLSSNPTRIKYWTTVTPPLPTRS